METKIKDITGAEITVTDLKEAVRQCRECLASPYLMPSGHTVGKTMPTCCGNCSPCKGGNGNTAGNGRENTTRKKSDDNCTAPQKLDTFGVFFMKYNYEIRLKAVKLVLEGGLSVREAGCHLGCGRSQVHLWVTLFERHGLTGLKLRHGSYSAEFKLSVLKHMHQNHLSLLETAVHFGIPGPFVIRQWERLYQNQGAEGLRRKPQKEGGRP